MSVRAYNPADNSPVLLSDTEAADAITSGRYVLADDQAVPVREPSGAINRYRAADLPRLLSQQGYALDFVNGNQQRYEELYRQRTSDVLRQEYGAAGEAVATTAMSAANAASFGLANTSQQQDEDERLAAVRNNTPNQGEVEKYLNSGYSYDDALLLANASYRRPTITESMEANSPIAGGVGTALGFVGGALATAPVSIAAEGAVAARAAAALASRGLGATAASVGGRVAAGAAVGAVEAAATGAAVRVGEGIIREQLPEFSGEELMVLGGLGAVVGGGLNLAVNIPTMLRSRAAGNQAPLVAPVVSNRDAINRLGDDITASLAPESITPRQQFIVNMNQTVGQVDPSLNASFFNPVKQNLANISDEAFVDEGTDIAARFGEIQSLNDTAELAVSRDARSELNASMAGLVDNAPNEAALLRVTDSLDSYNATLADASAFNGRGLMEGRDSPIVSALRRNTEAFDRATSGARGIGARIKGLRAKATELAESRRAAALAEARAEVAESSAEFRASVERAASRSGFANVDDYLAAAEPSVARAVADAMQDFERPIVRLTELAPSKFLTDAELAMLDEARGLVPALQQELKQIPDRVINIQSNLANLSRGVKTSAEQELAGLADAALLSIDNFLTRADVFGAGASTAFRNMPSIRTMQSNRNQLLKLFGRDGITELDRVGRDFDPGKLVSLATKTTDADTVAGRKVIADYLQASKRVARIASVAGDSGPSDLIDDVGVRLMGESDRVFPGQAPFFAVGRAKADFKQLQLQGNQGGTLRGVAPSIMSGMFGGLIASGQVVPAAALATMMAMRPDKRVAASYALRNLRSALDRTKSQLVTAIGERFSMPAAKLSVSKQVARKVITAMPELFEGDDKDQAFDNLVGVVNEAAGNPDYMAGAAESLGVNPNSRNGSEAITNMVAAMEYLRQQMPESLFEPMNPNPPSQRVSGMVKFNIMRAVETIMDPLSVHEDFANGFVSATKVQALRAVYPQLAEEMNARILAEYADRVSDGVRMPYATRMQVSMLLGTPIEQALRQPNLARLQSVYAQTPAQAQAQGMSRTPTRAVTSLLTSTTTEGASLQDLQ